MSEDFCLKYYPLERLIISLLTTGLSYWVHLAAFWCDDCQTSVASATATGSVGLASFYGSLAGLVPFLSTYIRHVIGANKLIHGVESIIIITINNFKVFTNL